MTRDSPTGRLRMKIHILNYGLCGGVLIVILKLVEHRCSTTNLECGDLSPFSLSDLSRQCWRQ